MNKIKAQQTLDKIIEKLSATAPQIGVSAPSADADGKYDSTPFSDWVSGFWPGILWTAYKASEKPEFAELAEKCGDCINDTIENDFYSLHHDVGFMWLLSAVMQYETTGDKKAATHALTAANLLLGRFNSQGKFIRAWNGTDLAGWAIIDCSMNISLLYWASKYTGDPRFSHTAQIYADTVLEHFIRPDGSVNHICSFDPETGEFIEALGGQGNAPDSAWARGTSWAIYGMALSYKHTKNVKYLDAAKRVAHFFIANLPDDYVSHWDFRVPRTDDTPRDTSASAIAACGMLEIAENVPECEKNIYFSAANKILTSLTDNYSCLETPYENQALLRAATGHKPANININVGIIYGDYFYIEGISRLIGETEFNWI